MLFNISLLGVAGLISACWAVPTHIDLKHQSRTKYRAKYGMETVTENEVSYIPINVDILIDTGLQGFWFGQFDIGNSKNLSLLIDTGSSDIIVNSPYYHPGLQSVNLGKNFSSSYGTTESDGSGTGTVCRRQALDMNDMLTITNRLLAACIMTQSNLPLQLCIKQSALQAQHPMEQI